MRPTLLRNIALLHRIPIPQALALIVVQARVYRDVDFHKSGLGFEAELGRFLERAIVVWLVGLAVRVLEEKTADLGICDEDIVGGDNGVVFFLVWRVLVSFVLLEWKRGDGAPVSILSGKQTYETFLIRVRNFQ